MRDHIMNRETICARYESVPLWSALIVKRLSRRSFSLYSGRPCKRYLPEAPSNPGRYLNHQGFLLPGSKLMEKDMQVQNRLYRCEKTLAQKLRSTTGWHLSYVINVYLCTRYSPINQSGDNFEGISV